MTVFRIWFADHKSQHAGYQDVPASNIHRALEEFNRLRGHCEIRKVEPMTFAQPVQEKEVQKPEPTIQGEMYSEQWWMRGEKPFGEPG